MCDLTRQIPDEFQISLPRNLPVTAFGVGAFAVIHDLDSALGRLKYARHIDPATKREIETMLKDKAQGYLGLM